MISSPGLRTEEAQAEIRLRPDQYAQPIFFSLALLLVIGSFHVIQRDQFSFGDQW